MAPEEHSDSPRIVSFGVFEADLRTGELRKHGIRLHLQEQPFKILAALLERPGEVVSREDLVQRLWPDGTFVDYDRGLNAAINRLRQMLSDSAESPRYVETLARRGYRFIAPVDSGQAADEKLSLANFSVALPTTRSGTMRRKWFAVTAIAAMVAAVAGYVLWPERPRAELRLERLTNDPGLTTDPALSPDNRLLAYASDRAGGGSLDIWVRQVSGGEPIRLTDHPADDHEPAFSPDGSQIAFRSERDGGGIYVVRTLGGESRLLAKLGNRPRYSPDGAWVAYWVGNRGIGHVTGQGTGKIFVVPASGGTPRDLQPEFAAARYPVWSPDGKWLLFVGSRVPLSRSAHEEQSRFGDWYVFPLDAGTAQGTGAFPVLQKQNFGTPLGVLQMAPSEWRDDRVTFAVGSGDSTNLWQIPLSLRTRRVNGPPERVTFGSGLEVQPALGGTNHKQSAVPLVFASLNSNMDIWSLPLRTDGTPAAAEPERLTEDLSADFVGSLSPDGKKMLFHSNRSGKFEVWMKDLENRRETPFVGTQGRALFSPDGSVVAHNGIGSRSAIYVTPSSGGIADKLCDDCGYYWDWSSDRKRVIYTRGNRDRVHFEVLDITSGKRSIFLQDPRFDLYLPNFSPDDRWINFLGRSLNNLARIYIAPFVVDRVVKESDWIGVTDPSGAWVDAPVWSADSNRLYYLSEVDGFRCLWGQELNPVTKQPVGKTFTVYHSHRSRLSLMNLTWGRGALAVSRDKAVFGQGELTGNIWMIKLPN